MVHLSELADLSLRLLWSKTNCFYPYADVRFQTNISTDEQITLSARFSFDCECSGCGRSGTRNFFTSLATTRYTGEYDVSVVSQSQRFSIFRRLDLRDCSHSPVYLVVAKDVKKFLVPDLPHPEHSQSNEKRAD